MSKPELVDTKGVKESKKSDAESKRRNAEKMIEPIVSGEVEAPNEVIGYFAEETTKIRSKIRSLSAELSHHGSELQRVQTELTRTEGALSKTKYDMINWLAQE